MYNKNFGNYGRKYFTKTIIVDLKFEAMYI